MLLFVPPYCRYHDDGRFRFTVIGYGLGLAVTSRFLWTAPYTNEILDVDTSKQCAFYILHTLLCLIPLDARVKVWV